MIQVPGVLLARFEACLASNTGDTTPIYLLSFFARLSVASLSTPLGHQSQGSLTPKSCNRLSTETGKTGTEARRQAIFSAGVVVLR